MQFIADMFSSKAPTAATANSTNSTAGKNSNSNNNSNNKSSSSSSNNNSANISSNNINNNSSGKIGGNNNGQRNDGGQPVAYPSGAAGEEVIPPPLAASVAKKEKRLLCRDYKVGNCDKGAACELDHVDCTRVECKIKRMPDCLFGHPKAIPQQARAPKSKAEPSYPILRWTTKQLNPKNKNATEFSHFFEQQDGTWIERRAEGASFSPITFLKMEDDNVYLQRITPSGKVINIHLTSTLCFVNDSNNHLYEGFSFFNGLVDPSAALTSPSNTLPKGATNNSNLKNIKNGPVVTPRQSPSPNPMNVNGNALSRPSSTPSTTFTTSSTPSSSNSPSHSEHGPKFGAQANGPITGGGKRPSNNNNINNSNSSSSGSNNKAFLPPPPPKVIPVDDSTATFVTNPVVTKPPPKKVVSVNTSVTSFVTNPVTTNPVNGTAAEPAPQMINLSDMKREYDGLEPRLVQRLKNKFAGRVDDIVWVEEKTPCALTFHLGVHHISGPSKKAVQKEMRDELSEIHANMDFCFPLFKGKSTLYGKPNIDMVASPSNSWALQVNFKVRLSKALVAEDNIILEFETKNESSLKRFQDFIIKLNEGNAKAVALLRQMTEGSRAHLIVDSVAAIDRTTVEGGICIQGAVTATSVVNTAQMIELLLKGQRNLVSLSNILTKKKLDPRLGDFVKKLEGKIDNKNEAVSTSTTLGKVPEGCQRVLAVPGQVEVSTQMASVVGRLTFSERDVAVLVVGGEDISGASDVDYNRTIETLVRRGVKVEVWMWKDASFNRYLRLRNDFSKQNLVSFNLFDDYAESLMVAEKVKVQTTSPKKKMPAAANDCGDGDNDSCDDALGARAEKIGGGSKAASEVEGATASSKTSSPPPAKKTPNQSVSKIASVGNPKSSSSTSSTTSTTTGPSVASESAAQQAKLVQEENERLEKEKLEKEEKEEKERLEKELKEIQSFVDAYLTCPITDELFYDPVCTKDGQTFERHAILEWLLKSSVCPMTQQPLVFTDLFANYRIKSQANDYRQKIDDYRTKLAKFQKK